MKPVNFLMALLAGLTMLVACNSVSDQKSKTGLLYKIISTGKDSVVKQGEWLKFYFQQKLNDSLLETNYGKAPLYLELVEVDPRSAYSPTAVFKQLHKGDSLITIAIVDSLKAKGLLQDFPPFIKKGDRLITYVKIVDVLKTDSLYKADAMAEE